MRGATSLCTIVGVFVVVAGCATRPELPSAESAVHIRPAPLRQGDTPACEWGLLPPEKTQTSWTLNGQPAGTGPAPDLPLWPGDVLRCEVTVTNEEHALVGAAETRVRGGNLLIVVSDDQGPDWVGAYGEADPPARTPNIDRLAEEGLLFRRAFANPTCSPTRATMITGRLAHRMGLGMAISGLEPFEIPDSERTIAEVLHDKAPEYTTQILGKWHLGHTDFTGLQQPMMQGFDRHYGSFNSLFDYDAWNKNKNGTEVFTTEYATVDTANDAIEAILTAPEPWVLFLTFNAPHAPLHAPPSDLHTYDLPAEPTDLERFAAMVESLDTELGRVLDSLQEPTSAHTNIVFLSDNGTMGSVLRPPETNGGKGGIRETGLRVPLIVHGPAVANPGTESMALVHTVDLFPTIAELVGVALSGDDADIDGESFAAVLRDAGAEGRQWVYADVFRPNGPGPYDMANVAVRDDRFKLHRRMGAPDELYDLEGRYREGPALTWPLDGDAADAYERLTQILDQLDPPG